jgi:hypothetical protein
VGVRRGSDWQEIDEGTGVFILISNDGAIMRQPSAQSIEENFIGMFYGMYKRKTPQKGRIH